MRIADATSRAFAQRRSLQSCSSTRTMRTPERPRIVAFGSRLFRLRRRRGYPTPDPSTDQPDSDDRHHETSFAAVANALQNASLASKAGVKAQF
jgi:hypothetical protein